MRGGQAGAPRVELGRAPDRAAAAAAAAEAFRSAFGTACEGVWSAPGRVNLIGEHVDYQGGLCLPMAIEQRCFVAAARTSGHRLRLRSVQSGERFDLDVRDLPPGSVSGWGAYPAGVVWALEARHGLDLLIDGQVPLGAGLSSSAALECAVAAALEDLLDLGTSAAQRIRAAIRAETEFVGAPTGGLDQSASVLASAGHALLLDCADGSARPVPWDLAAEGLALLMIDTRAEHSHVTGEYAQRREQSIRAAEAIGVPTLREAAPADLERIADPLVRRRARHIITEIARVRETEHLLEAGPIRPRVQRLGELLDASHASLREDYEVTVPALDLAVEAARAAGAHGARMTGGGFGGSIIALVEAPQAQEVLDAVAAAFADAGLEAPVAFLTAPSAGAGRDL